MATAINPKSDPLDVPDPEGVRPDIMFGLRSMAAGFDLKLAFLFLALYFIRPQDWVPGMAGFNIIRPLMFAWFLVIFTAGSRSAMSGWLRTPHDWAILIYFIYVVWVAPSESGTMSAMFSLSVFYYLTCQALSTWDAIEAYLKVWNLCLVCLASFGVMQTFGLDITNGAYTTAFFEGRLSLGTWMTNNPNALGHTVIVAIPLSFVMLFWKGSGFSRTILFPLAMLLIGWCAWETQSKGAFLVGAGLSMLLFVVGRPLWIKILVLSIALTMGVGALSFLPRMENIGNLRADEGVQGRLKAWELAKGAMDTNTFGVGYKKFIAIYPYRWGKRIITVVKATHSSYVQVGADLGLYGLAVWLLVLWTALRTAAFFRAENDQQERCRRALTLLLAGYLASGWMINRQYYTEYFLIVAVAAAVHRLAYSQQSRFAETPLISLGGDDPSGPLDQKETFKSAKRMRPSLVHDVSEDSGAEKNEQGEPPNFWNRIGFADLAMAAALTWVVNYIWGYVLTNL